jgi:lipase
MSAVFVPLQRSFHHNGLELSYFEWGVHSADKPSLLFVHATGFHGRCWDEIIERFPDCHIIAFEQHGHGRSEGEPVEHWQLFGDQLTAFITSRDHRFDLGIGHSMGGHTLVMAAADSQAIDRLLLIDPTIFDPELYATDEDYRAAFAPGQAPSERRRSEYPSVEAMKEGLAIKGSFPVYTARAYDDYCRYGLIEQEDGLWHLACAPKMEASIYLSGRSNSAIFESVHAVHCPVHIMRAKERGTQVAGKLDFSFSPTWEGLVKEFPNATEHYYPELTHFIPMQVPDEVERVIREMVPPYR